VSLARRLPFFPSFFLRLAEIRVFFGKSQRARADLQPTVNVTLTAALLIEGETESKGDPIEKETEREREKAFIISLLLYCVLAPANLFIRYFSALGSCRCRKCTSKNRVATARSLSRRFHREKANTAEKS